jgi:hypothetical protein
MTALARTNFQQGKLSEALEMETKKQLAEEEYRAAAITAVRNPPCGMCGGVSFEACSGCGFVHYCDRACQMKHWPDPKTFCRTSPIYKTNQKLETEKKTLEEQERTLGVDHKETLPLRTLARSKQARSRRAVLSPRSRGM